MDSAINMDASTIGGWVSVIIGLAVSLDVVALTFCSPQIVFGTNRQRVSWSVLNGLWHAGLLLCYLLFIDFLAVGLQLFGFWLNLELPDFLSFFRPAYEWFTDRFRSHIILYASTIGMAFVWYQYSYKVVSTPTDPSFDDVPRYLRWIFRVLGLVYPLVPKILRSSSRERFVRLNLACCLVAVDMLALAAVIKSGEKALQFPDGISKIESTFASVIDKISASLDLDFMFRTAEVTLLTLLIVSVTCYVGTIAARTFWSRIEDDGAGEAETAMIIVLAMKIFEPLVIFYFIIHGTAFIATGVPIHNPAFVLGSALLVAALIQYVGFAEIVKSSSNQARAGLNPHKASAGLA